MSEDDSVSASDSPDGAGRGGNSTGVGSGSGGFTNISDEDGILQVIISGGVHDMNDIDFTADCGKRIENIQMGLRAKFEETGFTFTAGNADT